jgi:hypothetical protein
MLICLVRHALMQMKIVPHPYQPVLLQLVDRHDQRIRRPEHGSMQAGRPDRTDVVCFGDVCDQCTRARRIAREHVD